MLGRIEVTIWTVDMSGLSFHFLLCPLHCILNHGVLPFVLTPAPLLTFHGRCVSALLNGVGHSGG